MNAMRFGPIGNRKQRLGRIRVLLNVMSRLTSAVLSLAAVVTVMLANPALRAQVEGPVPTQTLVTVDAKSVPPNSGSELTVAVEGHKEPLSAWAPVLPAKAQVALLIDDGLRTSLGRELDNLHNFVAGLPPGVEVLIGYLQNGHVVAEQPFTADHAQAASALHLPTGMPGISASPYICLSDFVKHWPTASSNPASAGIGGQPSSRRKARFVLMITDGVDPYNGGTSVMNQDSPYVSAAVTDAQRAGVSVSAIYFSDAGISGASADNSGQNYLAELAQDTGGVSYWEGIGNPVTTTPFLMQFQKAIAETYLATFPAPVGRNPQTDMVHIKFSAERTKLHAPAEVLPGNQE